MRAGGPEAMRRETRQVEEQAAPAPRPEKRGRRPVRMRVSTAEKAFCLLLLAALPLAAGAVYRKGQQYDRSLYALDPALVAATARKTKLPTALPPEPAEGRAGATAPASVGTAPLPAGFAPPGAEAGALAPGGFAPLPGPTPGPAPAAGAPPAGIFPSAFGDGSWMPAGRVERFEPGNLYEKIDGRADQYLKYGVAGLQCATYTDRKDAARFLDAYVYDMGSTGGAFGIWSAERPAGAQALKLGDQGYRAEASYFFTRGRRYVQVVASDGGKVFQDAGLKLAQALDAALGGAAPPLPPAPALAKPPAPPRPAGGVAPKPPVAAGTRPAPDFASPKAMLALFPAQDLVPDSGEYLKQDALGMEFLKDVTTNRYRVGGKEYRLFLARPAGDGGAAGALGKYVEFVQQIGKVEDRQTLGKLQFVVSEVAGFTDAVFAAGPFFGGVNGAGDRAAAEELAARLLRSLAAGAPGTVPPEAGKVEKWPAPKQPS